MNETYKKIEEFLAKEKIRLMEQDEHSFTVRFQMHRIVIHVNQEDPNFVAVVLSGFAEVNEENAADATYRCYQICRQMKVAKAYHVNSMLLASYEFYYLDTEDLAFQLKKGLGAVISVLVAYRKMERQGS